MFNKYPAELLVSKGGKIVLGDYFLTIPVLADSKEALDKEIEFNRVENEKLNPKLKIYAADIRPNPEEVKFNKGDYKVFEVDFECELKF